jgi:glycosyltransferase involved in cell wall biosynthesis
MTEQSVIEQAVTTADKIDESQRMDVSGLPQVRTTRRPKVSICMIVKNEEANLQRCLDSLLPIIAMRDDETLEPLAELIIVDTGSTDRTMKVARKFTRKVFRREFVPWDFAAARNYSIEQAAGEKLLIMDADEQLDQHSVYLLEDLILNPAYAGGTAFFTIRNYANRQRTSYSEMAQPRLYTNDGKPIYERAVHHQSRAETPHNFCPTVVIHHYGYQWDDEGLKQKKKNRSIPLLLEEYEADPNDIHALTHLTKTCSALGERDKVIEYGEQWLRRIQEIETTVGWFAYYECFVLLANAYIEAERVEDAEAILALVEEKYTDRLVMLPILIGRYWLDKDDDKALRYLEHGLELAARPMTVHEMLLTSNVKQAIPQALLWCAVKYFERGDYEKAGKYIRDAIMNNNGVLEMRWDVWNYPGCKARLKPMETNDAA